MAKTNKFLDTTETDFLKAVYIVQAKYPAKKNALEKVPETHNNALKSAKSG